jgi:hypothetical protein
MIRLDPTSSSELLRATHIALVRIETSEISEWQPAGRIEQRRVLLKVTLLELYKGELRERVGAAVSLPVWQCRPAGLRIFAVPGVWSGNELEPGSRFVLFSVSPSQIAAEVFAEPSLFRVEPAATAVPDVLLALRGGVPEISIADHIARCNDEMPTWGYLFARYFEARMPEAFFNHFRDFDALMRAIEDPQLSAIATRILLPAAYSKLMLYDPAPSIFLHRLLMATERVLETSRGEFLRSAVLETYLPNLLGITGGLTQKHASEVLAYGRKEFEQFLQGANEAVLLSWVRT